MFQHRYKLVRVVVAIVVMSMLVMSIRLWSPPRVPMAYAIPIPGPTPLPCGTDCENITNTPSAANILNGSDGTATFTLTFSLNSTKNNGWNVTITSTTFSTGSPVHTLATTASSVTGVTAVCTAGYTCTTLPTNQVTYPLAVPAGTVAPTPVKLNNAIASTGKGTYDISPVILIAVPANAYAGTYTSTITLAYVVGP